MPIFIDRTFSIEVLCLLVAVVSVISFQRRVRLLRVWMCMRIYARVCVRLFVMRQSDLASIHISRLNFKPQASSINTACVCVWSLITDQYITYESSIYSASYRMSQYIHVIQYILWTDENTSIISFCLAQWRYKTNASQKNTSKIVEWCCRMLNLRLLSETFHCSMFYSINFLGK